MKAPSVPPSKNLLQHYCHQSDFILLCEKTRSLSSDNEGSEKIALNRRIRPDGEVVDAFGLPHGYWEAKDTHDDLYTEADKKFAAGYFDHCPRCEMGHL